MTWDTYLSLTINERWTMHEELNAIIERTNPDEGGAGPGGMRPKNLRRMR